MSKQTPRPLKLGSIIKAYTDEVAEHGEDEINKRADKTIEMIVERFRSTPLVVVPWADIISKYQLDTDCHCRTIKHEECDLGHTKERENGY